MHTDADKYSETSIPKYKCGNLLRSFIAFHVQLSKWITPVYVFDGLAPFVKKEEMAKRFGKKIKSGKDYFNLRDRAVKDSSLSFTLSELENAWKTWKDMAGPYEYDHANVLQEHYGSIAGRGASSNDLSSII